MTRGLIHLKCAVAALITSVILATGAFAQTDEVDVLFEGLKTADSAAAAQIENRIYAIWSQTGSDAMDLLLERGRDAMTEGDFDKAVQHFSALIDHAPEFPEGYNARATAHFQAGRYGQSIEDIRATLAINPRHFGAISGLALIFEELGKTESALAAWREVKKLIPAREGVDSAIQRLEQKIHGQEI